MSILAELTAGALEDAQARAARTPLDALERHLQDLPAARNARAALVGTDRVKIIAEVKRASPSRGDLATIPDPARQALLYQEGGASAISVLTEGRRFKGSLADLSAVKAAVDLPVLRKDFIVTPYQVYEARAAGADLVLLIVAALDQSTLISLHALVEKLGMTALVEAHTADEIARAVDVGARVIGVNARDLTTFDLDPHLFGSLRDRIPHDTIAVAESAVHTPADVARYRADGADVVLIGEALVTGDPVATLRAFLSPTATDSQVRA